MSKNNLYDVIIIGAGPSGIFCDYELIRQKPELKILMVEKGRPIEKRVCPKRTTKVCVGCKPCSITTGFAGAGAFSEKLLLHQITKQLRRIIHQSISIIRKRA